MPKLITQTQFDYIHAAGIVPDDRSLTGFAEACYNQNNVDDLLNSLAKMRPDEVDMKTWDLSEFGWRDGIRRALAARAADFLEL